MDIIGLHRDIYAFFVELEGHIKLLFHLVLLGDLLIDADQVLKDLNLDSVKVSLGSLAESSLELAHGLELVMYVFFAEAETFVRQGLTFKIFEVERHIQTPLMEVTRRTIILLLFISRRHALISPKAVSKLALPPVHLRPYQVLPELCQHLLVRFFIFSWFTGFSQLELFLVLRGGFDLRGRRLLGQVEEVYVGLHESFGQKGSA